MNIAKTLVYPQSNFYDMIVHQDTITGYGIAFKDSITWKQGLVIAQFDSSGNVIAVTFIQDSLGDKFAVDKHWGKIIRTSDGGYAATAATVGRNSAFLLKLDKDLNIQFIKEYPDTINLSNYFYKLLETPQGYLLYGAIQRPDFYDDGFIRHVDKAGNTIWFKYLQFSNVFTVVQDIKPLNDSIYLSNSLVWTDPSQSKPEFFNAFLTFHSNGQEIQYKATENNPKSGIVLKILDVSPANFLTYGQYVPSQNGNTILYQSTISKFNSNHQAEWHRHFGLIRSAAANVFLHEFAPTADGNYIGAGETLVKDGNDPTRRVGWLYKFSPQGDSIWERKINVPFLPLYYTNNGYFSGVGVLSSGNIVAGGTANEGNKEYCWLVKISNAGCMDTLFCQSVAVTQAPENRSTLLQFSPNPAREQLRISYPEHPGGGQIRLYDMQGRLQQNIVLPEGSSSYVLPVQHLSEGIYFAHWLYAGTSGVKKIVIAH